MTSFGTDSCRAEPGAMNFERGRAYLAQLVAALLLLCLEGVSLPTSLALGGFRFPLDKVKAVFAVTCQPCLVSSSTNVFKHLQVHRKNSFKHSDSTSFLLPNPKIVFKLHILKHSSFVRPEQLVNYDANGFSVLPHVPAGRWPRKARTPHALVATAQSILRQERFSRCPPDASPDLFPQQREGIGGFQPKYSSGAGSGPISGRIWGQVGAVPQRVRGEFLGQVRFPGRAILRVQGFRDGFQGQLQGRSIPEYAGTHKLPKFCFPPC